MKHTLFACLLLGVTLGFCIFSSVTVRAETQRFPIRRRSAPSGEGNLGKA